MHLVRQVYNKAPPLGLTEGVAAMAAEAVAAATAAAAAVVVGVIELVAADLATAPSRTQNGRP